MTKTLVSRRAFLKGGGALALSTPVLAREVFAAQTPENKAGKTCVIIGAGLSGLAAAYRLQNSGWRVVVVEARPRLGGRVLTQREPETGFSFELGGEWIVQNHTRFFALCRDFNLPLQREKMVRVSSREYSQSAQDGWQKFAAAWPNYSLRDFQNLDRNDWQTWLSRIGFSANDLRLRQTNDGVVFGETIRQVSAFVAARKFLKTNETRWKIRSGNDALPRALAERIGLENFRLQTKATSITQKEGAVFVQAGNEVLRADACVCTVPARVLNQISFLPELPAAQVKAAWELQSSRVVKSGFTFEKQFWKNEFYASASPTASQHYFHFSPSSSSSGRTGVLTTCAVGDGADIFALQSVARKQQIIARELKNAVGRAPRFESDIVSHAWQRDPFSQGANAIYRPGQWFSIRPILKQAHGKVFFAGEHLADLQGTMEGAIETGEAAAGEVMSL